MARRERALAGVLPVALVLASCGGVAPRRPDPALRFPKRAYIVGRGVTSYSAAAGEADARRAAELGARARVAEQVMSVVRARLRVEEQAGPAGEQRRAWSRVETAAGFERGELIEVVAGATRCEAGQCVALAVLDRARASERLVAEHAARRRVFDEAAAAADRAATAGDVRRFTSALRDVERDLPALFTLARQLEAIGGEAYGPQRAVRARAAELEVRRRGVLAGAPVVVAVSGATPELREALSRALVAGFAEIGLSATPGASCERGLRFESEASVRCASGGLGRSCRLSLSGRLWGCAGGAALAEVDFSGVRVAGIHPSDERRARGALIEALGRAALAPALRASLAAALPVSVAAGGDGPPPRSPR